MGKSDNSADLYGDWPCNDGVGTRGEDDGNGACGGELQPYNAGEEERGACLGDRWGV